MTPEKKNGNRGLNVAVINGNTIEHLNTYITLNKFLSCENGITATTQYSRCLYKIFTH